MAVREADCVNSGRWKWVSHIQWWNLVLAAVNIQTVWPES